MRDGLYRVETRILCAGFVVKDGRVKRSQCAPILRRRLKHWARLAKYVGP